MPQVKQLDQSLQRLVCRGRCPPEQAEGYGEKLRALGREAANPEEVEPLSRMFKALGDETRLGLVNLLSTREMCVCELMAALDLTQPTASHHLMILENAGIVKGKKEGKWVFYRIVEENRIKRLLETVIAK
jgi:DNA-binding transcriptional ArsR family regulator